MLHPILAQVVAAAGGQTEPVGDALPTQIGTAGVYQHATRIGSASKAAVDAAGKAAKVDRFLTWSGDVLRLVSA